MSASLLARNLSLSFGPTVVLDGVDVAVGPDTRLGDADWARVGTHSESGAYGVETWLEIYTAHPYDHADQIAKARASA